jgi:hypothetical protein
MGVLGALHDRRECAVHVAEDGRPRGIVCKWANGLQHAP